MSGTNTFDSDVEINGGRIIAASAQALGDTGNTIVINTGKLEVASGTTLNSGYTIQETQMEVVEVLLEVMVQLEEVLPLVRPTTKLM